MVVRLSSFVLACALLACTPGSGPDAAGSPAPATGTPPVVFTAAVIGDWGAGTDAQARVARRMCEVRRTEGFSDVITTGDNFYEPDGTARARNYYDPSRCLIEHESHRWRGSWGNHDAVGRSTGSVLGAERWYAWSAGGADLIALDSNRVGNDEQRRFLRERLAGSAAAVKIVYFHHPPFTVGAVHPNDERVQRAWVPLFERYDVTLVLTGHQHDYEHSRVRGIDYVVTGGGGQDLYACVREPATLIECHSAYHFLLLRIEGTKVTVHAIRPNGETLDRFSISA